MSNGIVNDLRKWVHAEEVLAGRPPSDLYVRFNHPHRKVEGCHVVLGELQEAT